MIRKLLQSQQVGLLLVILMLATLLTLFAGTYPDRQTGAQINRFFNRNTLLQTATDASFIAVMAVGATFVIISRGIDLSVGSIYALSGVMMAMLLEKIEPIGDGSVFALGLSMCLGVALIAGLLNGVMVVVLRVHPFIVTLGTMWVFRGIAFVSSEAKSILVPPAMNDMAKAPLGVGPGLYPIPMLVMLAVTGLGAVLLSRTVMGRHIFAVGGNPEASRYCGLPIGRILIGVYVVSSLCAGIAAFIGSSFYGAASSADGTGYELYVIAAAVVGGASLTGGRGSAVNAMLGAVLIVLIRQSIRTLHLDQNYEWIIIGSAIIAAVVLDRASGQFAKHRLARAAAR